jgi:fumarate reductase flavoprotein subunit
MSNRDVDVLVIGSGLAGLAAAIAAHEAGCRDVLVAESEKVVGGASRLSGGIMIGSGSRLQRANGIEDSIEQAVANYLTMNRFDVDAAPARRLMEDAGATIDWLEEQGVVFKPGVFVGGNEVIPQSHWVEGDGAGLVDALHARCRALGIQIALDRRVDRLIVEDGRVAGAAVGDDEIRAGATVIATGGFGANKDRLAKLWPDALAGGDWTVYLGVDAAPGSRGDGIDLGDSVGAQIVGHNRGLRLLHTGFHSDYDAAPPGYLVYLDGDGRRFINEDAHYGTLDHAAKQRGNRVFAVLDDRLLRTRGIPQSKYDPEGLGRPVNFNDDLIDQMVAQGRAVKADTIEELAAALGLDGATVRATIDRYNENVAAGFDADCVKNPKFLQPISTPPYYGVELRPAVVGVSACGLRIDRDARVLGRDGCPIPGLLAAGETTGRVIGEFYVGSGNSLTNSATFGRIAGRTAAASVAAVA